MTQKFNIRAFFKYNSRFTDVEKDLLKHHRIMPFIVNSYPNYFHPVDIIELYNNNILPHESKIYFEALEDVDSVQKKRCKLLVDKYKLEEDNNLKHPEENKVGEVLGETLDEHSENIIKSINMETLVNMMYYSQNEGAHYKNASCIIALKRLGVTPDFIKSHDKIKEVFSLFDAGLFKNNSFKIFSSGYQGIILKEDNNLLILKYGMNVDHEFGMLKKLDQYKPLKNVVGLNSNPEHIKNYQYYNFIKNFLMLDYVPGETLERKLNNNLSNKQILKYAHGLLNGLSELRSAGIYHHRDLRPANIIIDSVRDEPVIIDLGIATTDKNALPKDNRRYGGPNDLVSLGQIVYKMATGEHLFVESKSMEKTVYADNIKDARDKIYEDETGQILARYLLKVDSKVNDKSIANLVKDCLTANADDVIIMKAKYL